ncbi:hypothetical protein [Actinomadura nitritigenes]|uniref:hypothetical protein n=1 Tax=Actinomadura nitritigenes TaxID=134602 RepID=UPI003D89DE30
MNASGRVLVRELDRVAELAGVGAGRVQVEPLPAVKLASLARYGMASKAPTLRDLEERRHHTSANDTRRSSVACGALIKISVAEATCRAAAGSRSATAGGSASATARAWRTSSARSAWR